MVELDKEFYEKFLKFALSEKEIETLLELGIIEKKMNK